MMTRAEYEKLKDFPKDKLIDIIKEEDRLIKAFISLSSSLMISMSLSFGKSFSFSYSALVIITHLQPFIDLCP